MRKPMNRRMFLRGTGGAMLAIPFLPSLTSKAFAADPGPGVVGKCFFAIGTEHGGAYFQDMYPDPAVLKQTLEYAGRTVHHGALPTAPNNDGNVVFSPICSANSAVMTPSLVSKFNVVKGLDVPYRCGHQYGINLGAYAEPWYQYGVAGSNTPLYYRPTIDQAMAYSPSFYSPADLQNTLTQRAFAVNSGRMSWNFASPTTQTGTLLSAEPIISSLSLFNHFFNPGDNLGSLNTFVVDRIKQDYERVKKDPRLSKGDGQRLDQYLEQLVEIERVLLVAKNLPNPPEMPLGQPLYSGGNPIQDSSYYSIQHSFGHSPDFQKKWCDLLNKVIVQAFQSGASRIGTWHHSQGSALFTETVVAGSRHGDIFHKGLGVAVADAVIFSYLQGTFEHIMVDLAAKMDAVQMADGKTLLDHSLITWTQESGQMTHHTLSQSYPLVMAGGAGGYFNTGHAIDYSNKSIVYNTGDYAKQKQENPKYAFESPGLYYQQFLGNVMHAMGIPAGQWEHFTEFTADGPSKSTPTKGYGFHLVPSDKAADYAQAKLVMGDKLPVITS